MPFIGCRERLGRRIGARWKNRKDQGRITDPKHSTNSLKKTFWHIVSENLIYILDILALADECYEDTFWKFHKNFSFRGPPRLWRKTTDGTSCAKRPLALAALWHFSSSRMWWWFFWYVAVGQNRMSTFYLGWKTTLLISLFKRFKQIFGHSQGMQLQGTRGVLLTAGFAGGFQIDGTLELTTSFSSALDSAREVPGPQCLAKRKNEEPREPTIDTSSLYKYSQHDKLRTHCCLLFVLMFYGRPL